MKVNKKTENPNRLNLKNELAVRVRTRLALSPPVL